MTNIEGTAKTVREAIVLGRINYTEVAAAWGISKNYAEKKACGARPVHPREVEILHDMLAERGVTISYEALLALFPSVEEPRVSRIDII